MPAKTVCFSLKAIVSEKEWWLETVCRALCKPSLREWQLSAYNCGRKHLDDVGLTNDPIWNWPVGWCLDKVMSGPENNCLSRADATTPL